MNKLKAIRIGDKAFELDLRGWICPFPKYVLEFTLPKLNLGDRLDLLVDCPGAITDIPDDASKANCETEVTQIGNGEWKIAIHK
ncbi:MAG: sulfurtransferase TusA family protein [candidate division Zixibacteria bacterium]|nr:sulfurtransferase TusA family protein [candidate division Zixibacteria bacterium]